MRMWFCGLLVLMMCGTERKLLGKYSLPVHAIGLPGMETIPIILIACVFSGRKKNKTS